MLTYVTPIVGGLNQDYHYHVMDIFANNHQITSGAYNHRWESNIWQSKIKWHKLFSGLSAKLSSIIDVNSTNIYIVDYLLKNICYLGYLA